MERLPHPTAEDIAVLEPLPEPDIHYPDSDGKPMGENDWQREWIVRVIENLKLIFLGRDDVYVTGDLFWYPVEGNNRVVTAPDAMVVFGRPPHLRRCYKQWEEADTPPAVVFEILSPSNTPHDVTRLLRFYNRHGVQECYIYDPASNEFSAYGRSEAGVLEEIAHHGDWVSPRLGIRFEHTPNSFRIFRPDGSEFETTSEIYRRAEEQRQFAEQQRRFAQEQRSIAAEQQRFAAEQQRFAEEEKRRADALAERLRQLGIDPDAP